jgi:hypothetical protein
MSDTKIDSNVPPYIMAYLHEIAERLQTRHASVMVGAGFSKNAEGNNKSKKFLSWNELGDKFFDKLNEGCTHKKKKEFLNPLKLASEVEAAFGRPTLNNIIRSSIPDNEFQPSELHKKLLSLPWTDVFTTNYDTLLERAAENILQFRYEPIINSEDLIWSTKPRIIKLHGSFPSERPFIITEEDYRTYPSNNAPFVNTVQQSLLENTLCLIGFSGDDPNFLSWIGWIRDNLGTENSPKMYLIGILSLSNGQRKLLEDRNIIPVDISFYSKNKNHYDALTHFINFLLVYCQNEEKQKWPDVEDIQLDPLFDGSESKIKKTIEVWEKTRKKYPNWLIVPYNRRLSLQLGTTNHGVIHYFGKIEKPLDITILFEFNWRLEKSLYPLLSNWAYAYRSVVDSYNPYPDMIQISDSLVPNKKDNIEWEKIGNYWIELQLSLLSYYRQEGMDGDWKTLSERISAIKVFLSPEQNARYNYERCLKQLFSLSIAELREELKLWSSNPSLPCWEAKRAGLIAEIGNLDEARNILEASLKRVRNNLFLNPVNNNYYDISQEAYILQLLDYVQEAISFIREENSEDTEREKYRNRWQQIKENGCDPWKEIEQYDVSFKIEPPPYKELEKEYGFNIGQQIIHRKWGDDEYTLKAYSFLKFMEELGIPFKLSIITFSDKTAGRALKRIANYSPKWALVTLIRTGDKKNVDSLFSRKALARLNQEYVDNLSASFLDILRKSVVDLGDDNSLTNTNIFNNLAKILPHILSRLCVKNSYEIKIKILMFIKDVYSTEKRSCFEDISLLMENLIESFSNKEQQQLFSEFLGFPIVPDTHINKYPDPFMHIDIENKKDVKYYVNEEQITRLIAVNFNTENPNNREICTNIRRKYITRLVVLWWYEQLNEEQKNIFANLLWEKRKTNGFPSDTNYYEFTFLRFPYPQKLEPTPMQLFEEYIDKSDNWFVSTSYLKDGIERTGGYSNIISNILGTNNEYISYHWSKDRINNLFLKIIKWWNYDKKYLIEYEDMPYIIPIADEFKARFSRMIHLFICIFAPNIELIEEKNYDLIDKLLKELPDYKMKNLAAKASFIKLFPNNEKEILSEIESALLSQDEEGMKDAINATMILVRQDNKNITTLISIITQKIKYRTKMCLSLIIDAVTIIVEKYQQYLDEPIIDDINIGLKYLLGELEIGNDDMEHIHIKLDCRILAIKLLLTLSKYFIENNCEEPEYMKKWEERCLDKNEFSEIRNAWINNE